MLKTEWNEMSPATRIHAAETEVQRAWFHTALRYARLPAGARIVGYGDDEAFVAVSSDRLYTIERAKHVAVLCNERGDEVRRWSV